MNEKKWKLKKKNTHQQKERKNIRKDRMLKTGSFQFLEGRIPFYNFCRSFPPWKNGTQKSV